MKKLFIFALSVIFSASLSNAQEAFKHLGIGLEAGTGGAGIEVSFPLVSDHLMIKGGYNFPSFTVTMEQSISTSSINDGIRDVNSNLSAKGIPSSEHIKTTFPNPEMLNINSKLNFGAAKLMLEYYPSKKSSFHITAGLFFGTGDFLSASVETSSAFMNSYNALCTEVKAAQKKYGSVVTELGDFNPDELMQFNVGKNTYAMYQKDGKGIIDANMALAKIRPYFGIGFGRSIPRTRVGFQFDLGAWYHGTPAIVSSHPVAYNKSASPLFEQEMLDTLGNVKIYPLVTFRLTCRLF